MEEKKKTELATEDIELKRKYFYTWDEIAHFPPDDDEELELEIFEYIEDEDNEDEDIEERKLSPWEDYISTFPQHPVSSDYFNEPSYRYSEESEESQWDGTYPAEYLFDDVLTQDQIATLVRLELRHWLENSANISYVDNPLFYAVFERFKPSVGIMCHPSRRN